MHEIVGDGNCLFRSFSHQLHGNQDSHMHYRKETVRYMQDHKEEFKPFVAGDFDNHMKELGAHGTFAGNDAIVAFARNNCCDINIHQLSALVWTVRCDCNSRRKTLNIALLDEHYWSLTLKNENSQLQLSKSSKSQLDSELEKQIKRIQKVTGYKDVQTIKDTLKDCNNDEKEATSILLQLQEFVNKLDSNNSDKVEKIEKPSKSKQNIHGKSNKKKRKETKQDKKMRAAERRKNERMENERNKKERGNSDGSSEDSLADKLEFLTI